ncbi:hypothetical protein P261_01129 [Lachnospiraceae bacterium TWA4]|nr:hypothetical protein P261_01129 [Lachnospiraceae bacterium TWA4]
MSEDKVVAKHGRQVNQKLKPYMVLQYLLKNTDENHVVDGYTIVAALENWGISSERRSIYKDIHEINKASLALELNCTLQEAEKILALDDRDDSKLIVYDSKKKGYYVRQRHFDLNDIRLFVEGIYASKFLTEGQAKRLVNVVCEFVSNYQAEKIKHNVVVVDRVKTNNKSVLNTISLINEAMSKTMDGKPHSPERITFKYLCYSISDISKQIERKRGQKYMVSPYQLLINNGNYYLLAFDHYSKEMRTYRVDRMKNVSRTGQPREGQEEFLKIDLKTYMKRVFSMYSGEDEEVTICFKNSLLDVAIDHFGRKDISYKKIDEDHFLVKVPVQVSNKFFGWILGFGDEAKIIAPDGVVKEFCAYMDKIRGMY